MGLLDARGHHRERVVRPHLPDSFQPLDERRPQRLRLIAKKNKNKWRRFKDVSAVEKLREQSQCGPGRELGTIS